MNIEIVMFRLLKKIEDAAELASERTKHEEYKNATAFLLLNGAVPLVELSPYQVYFALNGQPEQDVLLAEVKSYSAVPKIAGEKCGKVRSGKVRSGKRVPKTNPVKCSCSTGTPNALNATITCTECDFVCYTTLDKILILGCGPMKMASHIRK